MQIPVYKSLLEIKTIFGIPDKILYGLVVFCLILAFFIKIYAVFPFILILMILKLVSKDDPLFLIIFFSSFKNRNYYNA